MKTSFSKTGLATILFSLVLAGCSSAPVEETSTDIEDTSVQTGQVDTSAIDDSAMESSADTVFYFDFDKALLKPESRAALLEHAASLSATHAVCALKVTPMSEVPVSTTWLWVSVALMRLKNSWYCKACLPA